MNAAEGILTARGGMTSHAALVARQMGKVCVAGCGALEIDYGTQDHDRQGQDPSRKATGSRSTAPPARSSRARSTTRPSEVLQVLIEKTLDPAKAPVYQPYAKLMAWADKYRTLKVRTNADQPDQARQRRRVRRRGHRPVPHRAHVLRRGQDRPDARDDPRRHGRSAARPPWPSCCRCSAPTSTGIFEAMDGRPVTIRTLDPPLHEFLPHDEKGAARARRADGHHLREGHGSASRRCTSSTRCSASAAAASASSIPRSPRCRPAPSSRPPRTSQKKGIKVEPEVMIPLVGHVKELAHQEKIVRARGRGGHEGEGREVQVPRRHDDRDPARRR